MNQLEESSHPLPLTPPVWIALALIALMGLARLFTGRDDIRTLGYLDRDNPVIVRSAEITHSFPSLGIRVTPRGGWSYLSVTDDDLATQPTFVNESKQAIVRIHAPLIAQWPSDVELKHRVGDATAEWIDLRRRPLVLSINALGTQLQHRWEEVDQRKIGRLVEGDSEVTIIAISHARQLPFESLESFCAAIEFIEDSD